MTQGRGPGAKDAGQRAVSVALIGRPSSVGRLAFSLIVVALLSLIWTAGCRNRALEQAQQEAREAKTVAKKMDYSLQAAAQEIATLKEELSAVRQDREELQKRLEQLIRERDQAAEFAQRAQEAISNLTTRESGQKSVTVALERQIAELKTLVDDQHKLIEQLKGAAAPPATTTAHAAADPNEKP